MNNFKELYDFIDRAVKSRKYPESTAQTLRAALKLYEAQLNEEESNSIDKFKENFEPITSTVFSKNANKFSASSLATYRSRTQKVLADFERYGDPQKMNSWSPKIIKPVVRGKKVNSEQSTGDNQSNMIEASISQKVPENMHKIELALRSDAKFVVIVPRDITKAEAATMKAIIDSLSIAD